MKRKFSIKNLLLDHTTILVLYIILAIAVSLQLYSLGHNQQFNRSFNAAYTSYNNYLIFKQSFFHLISGKDMYIHYPQEYFDLYKYSPTFALAMGLIAWLPDWAGLIIWNTLNVLVLFAAIRMLPYNKKTIAFILLFIIVELITSTQNSQSNAMLAGLMIGAFCFMERDKPIWATLLLTAAMFIKVYGAAGFVLCLVYPGLRRYILYSILWTMIMFAAPLIVTPLPVLIDQYISWGHMMQADQAASYGLSVMGWLHQWFGLQDGKNIITGIGIILFFIPFSRIRMYRDKVFRLLLLSFILIWVIIFNHKAESATFIIAVCGIVIWYFAQPATLARTIILWSAFIFVCLSATDLLAPLRKVFFEAYAIKPFACIIIWLIIFGQLMTIRQKDDMLTNNQAL